jgi:hypothetical protein
MTHLTFDDISELAEKGGADHAHLVECAQCRETLRRVQALLDATHALPRGIDPPPEVWAALRERLARTPTRAGQRWWHNGWLATAAGVVLVSGTAIVTSTGAPRAKGSKLPAPPQPTPTAVRAVDVNYVETVAHLREALERQRAALAPSTVATVDRALAVIDSAIAEARAALASDPANAALVDILSAHYERKVELLQRATELSTL